MLKLRAGLVPIDRPFVEVDEHSMVFVLKAADIRDGVLLSAALPTAAPDSNTLEFDHIDGCFSIATAVPDSNAVVFVNVVPTGCCMATAVPDSNAVDDVNVVSAGCLLQPQYQTAATH